MAEAATVPATFQYLNQDIGLVNDIHAVRQRCRNAGGPAASDNFRNGVPVNSYQRLTELKTSIALWKVRTPPT
jgi:hypothetical protein